MKNVEELKLYFIHGKHVVFVASHRGEELFLLLASQGIESRVVRINGHAQLELEEDVNLEVAQTVLDQVRRGALAATYSDGSSAHAGRGRG